MDILGRTEPGGSLRTHLDRVPRGVEPTVLGYERRYFGGLEQHLPLVFVLHAVEPLERLVFGRENSHRLKDSLWQGRIRRTSMTWITLTSLMFLSFIPLMQLMNPVSSEDSPHNRPFCSQEVSRIGVPDRNSGATTQLASHGSVM